MNEEPGSIWLRPVRAAKGPMPEYSRSQIAQAGVAVADADGLAAVTMRRVAEEVGAGSASLYRYVSKRDELLELMIDEVTGEFTPVTKSGDWPADLLVLAREFRGIYLRHPWVVTATAEMSPTGPNAVAFLENALTLLGDVEVESRVKLEAVAVLSGMVRLLVGFELTRAGSQQTIQQWQASQAAYLAHVADDGHHPHLTAALGSAGEGSVSEPVFDRVLARVLPGLLQPAASTDVADR